MKKCFQKTLSPSKGEHLTAKVLSAITEKRYALKYYCTIKEKFPTLKQNVSSDLFMLIITHKHPCPKNYFEFQ